MSSRSSISVSSFLLSCCLLVLLTLYLYYNAFTRFCQYEYGYNISINDAYATTYAGIVVLRRFFMCIHIHIHTMPPAGIMLLPRRNVWAKK